MTLCRLMSLWRILPFHKSSCAVHIMISDMIQSKPTDNITRPNLYKCPITLSQQISANCAKTTDDIRSAEMRKHCIGQNHDKCMGPDIGVIVNVSRPRSREECMGTSITNIVSADGYLN